MRNFSLALAVCGLLAAASTASAQQSNGFVQGFGGLRVGTTSSADTAFGAVVSGNLTSNIQVLGEAGRISNILPSTVDTLFDFSPVGFGVSAWYAEGGIRLTTGRGSGIHPYAETSAGFARMRGELTGLDGGTAATIANIGLRFLDRTDPMASVGGGFTIGGGPFVADLGYRYRKIFTSSWVDALTLGDSLHTNEVRLGIGFRF
jgi:hypothetical protein